MTDPNAGEPDFPIQEFEARVDRAQKAMHAAGMDCLFFTTEAEVRYFTGFRTLFWQSPTRPWFLVVPRSGKPIAVVPEIGAALMRATWIDDVRSWSSPHADDDGISLLSAVLSGHSVIGMPMGRESGLRMPYADFHTLVQRLGAGAELRDASGLMRDLRMRKSEREADKIRRICAIASEVFEDADRLFHIGQPLDHAFRDFKIALLRAGADDVPYLVGGAGPSGYADVISPPSGAPLREGDILMLDTGACRHGYFCDFDRNWAFRRASDAAKRSYTRLVAATEAALDRARPGETFSGLHAAMAGVIDQPGGDVGRFGHGLGMQLTEGASIIDFDHTVLEAGMVVTLEPSMTVEGDFIMVHEENILITEGAPELLSRRAPPELPILD